MRARWLLLLVAAYAMALALIALWSSPVDSGFNAADLGPVAWFIRIFGLTPEQGYNVTEFAANIALFIPLGIFARVLWPSLRWWQVALLAASVSTTIEILQGLLRPERFATVSDVVANTAGGLIGVMLCKGARSGAKLLRDDSDVRS